MTTLVEMIEKAAQRSEAIPFDEPKAEYITCKMCSVQVESHGYCGECQSQIDTGFIYSVKGGRCWNGAHRDMGQVIHALPFDQESGNASFAALCGTKPGYRSYGWVQVQEVLAPTCKKCLKKWEAQAHE